MPDEKWSGYTNRETFQLALLVENDQEMSETFRGSSPLNVERTFTELRDELVEKLQTQDVFNRENRKWIERLLVIGSLDRVNWREIVDTLRAD